MVFYLIGLGIGDAKDITVRGLEAVKSAERVYLEAYTSLLTVGKDALVCSMQLNIQTSNVTIPYFMYMEVWGYGR